MILTEVSAPPASAVPVRAFADHLRLGTGFADDGSQDAVLELYLRAAMAAIEARLGRALLARDFSLTLTCWREEASQGLPIGPVRAVDSVTLVAPDGEETAADPEGWSVVRDSQRPRLVGRFGRSLPRIPRSGHAEIRFSAGFGENWDEVPVDLRQAVFLLAAHFYENRSEAGSIAGSMPFGVLVLLEAYRKAETRGVVVTAPVRLLRRLVLEAPEIVPDGSGGFSVGWAAIGTLWADVTARASREDFVAGTARPRTRYRIVVRAAPVGAASRPRPEQRLREGARVFDILTVAERDADGRYLEIVAEEGVLP